MILTYESRTPENIASLKSLIKTDIMGSIDKNIELGNITLGDGAYRNSTDDLPLSVARGRHNKEVTDMVDQSIVTFVDEFQEQKAKLEQEIADRDKKLADKDKELAVRDKEFADRNHELADKEKKLVAQKAEGDAIIARLQAEIEELKKKR